MPTSNPRINVTLDKHIMSSINSLAKQQHSSVSTVAKELLVEALERREDSALSRLAEMRDNPKSKRLSHDDAWK